MDKRAQSERYGCEVIEDVDSCLCGRKEVINCESTSPKAQSWWI